MVLATDGRNTSSQSRMWKLSPSSPLNLDSLSLLLFPSLSFSLSLALRCSFENLLTPHNVNHENHTKQHLSKRKSAMFVYNLTKVCSPLERLSRHHLERPPTPPPPSASTCSPGDRYYLHGKGSGVNAVSKAPGSWQVKIKCLEIEM